MSVEISLVPAESSLFKVIIPTVPSTYKVSSCSILVELHLIRAYPIPAANLVSVSSVEEVVD